MHSPCDTCMGVCRRAPERAGACRSVQGVSTSMPCACVGLCRAQEGASLACVSLRPKCVKHVPTFVERAQACVWRARACVKRVRACVERVLGVCRSKQTGCSLDIK
ncbi:unnamed protein product [Cochlearia groenlandica]